MKARGRSGSRVIARSYARLPNFPFRCNYAQTLDADGSGTLSRKEFTRAMAHVPNLTEEKAATIFDAMVSFSSCTTAGFEIVHAMKSAAS
eukprot:1637321-Pleurochrysis_carterae.AAC.1